jgi:hypothetical protein
VSNQSRIDRIDSLIRSVEGIIAAVETYGHNSETLIKAAEQYFILESIKAVLDRVSQDVSAKEADFAGIGYGKMAVVVKLIPLLDDAFRIEAATKYDYEMRGIFTPGSREIELDRETFEEQGRILLESIASGQYIPQLSASPERVIYGHMRPFRLKDYKKLIASLGKKRR